MITYKIKGNLDNSWLEVSKENREIMADALSIYKKSISVGNFLPSIEYANMQFNQQTIQLLTALLVDVDAQNVSSALTELSEKLFCLASRLYIQELIIDNNVDNKLWVRESVIEHLILKDIGERMLPNYLFELEDSKIKLLSIETEMNKEDCIQIINEYENIKDFELI